MLLLSKKNPHLLQLNFLIYPNIRIHNTFELLTTSKMKISFPSSTTKRNNPLLNKTYLNLMPPQQLPSLPSTTSLSYHSVSHNDFLKTIEKKYYIQRGYRILLQKEVTEQLQLNNNTMMETINQRFTSFQSVMLQIMKDLVIQMVPQLTNHQRSNLLFQPPQKILHT